MCHKEPPSNARTLMALMVSNLRGWRESACGAAAGQSMQLKHVGEPVLGVRIQEELKEHIGKCWGGGRKDCIDSRPGCTLDKAESGNTMNCLTTAKILSTILPPVCPARPSSGCNIFLHGKAVMHFLVYTAELMRALLALEHVLLYL